MGFNNLNDRAIIIKILFPILLLCFNITAATAVTRYVTRTGNGLKDGSSWENASDDPQAMINISTFGDAVWIAAGTYTPKHTAAGWTKSTPTGVNNNAKDKHNSFVLKSGVKVYGGFAGNETDFGQRDWINNRTILSGDFDADDSGNNPADPKSAENAHHVVITINNAKGTVLDGFTVWGGSYYQDNNSDWGSIVVDGETVMNRDGGGIYAVKSGAALSNLEIRRNAGAAGGGLLCVESDSLRGYNLIFFKNFAGQGGGLYVKGSPKFKNIIVSANEAGVGSAISNTASGKDKRTAPHYINAFIHANLTSPANGYGSIQNELSDPTFTNSTIAGNFGGYCAGILNYYGSNITLNNTIIWNNMNTDAWSNVTGFAGVCDYEKSNTTTYNRSIVQDMDLTKFGGLDATAAEFDPKFIYLPTYYYMGNNGGSFTLQKGSPLIDAGSNELYEDACGNDFNGWENEYSLTPPPYTPFYDYSAEFWGAWIPTDEFSNKKVLRLTGSKIDIGVFEHYNVAESDIMKVETDAIDLYPNPAKENVTISGLSENASFSIYDLSGKVIRSYTATGETTISANFAKGIYLVKINNADKTETTKKLVIVK